MIATVHVTPECVENAIFERGAESKSRANAWKTPFLNAAPNRNLAVGINWRSSQAS